MDDMKSSSLGILCIKVLMFTAAVCGIGLIAGMYPLQSNIPLVIVPSLVVLFAGKPVFFEKLKLSTLLVSRVLAILAALYVFDPQYYVNFVLVMLIINILEATLVDAIRYKEYCNALSGLAVALGVLTLRGAWLYDAPSGDYYLAEGVTMTVTICYIAAYTLWNWIFVTHEFSPSVALLHVGMLSAPILGCITTLGMGAFGGVGMWLLVRANSLSAGGWMQIGAKSWFEEQFANESFARFVQKVQAPSLKVLFMIINLTLIGICFYITSQHGGLAYTLQPFMSH